MKKKIHRIISLILAISLFLAGGYIDTVMADSLFVCGSEGRMLSTFSSCHADINDTAICITGLLNLCNMKLQPSGRYQRYNEEAESFLNLLCSGVWSMPQGKPCAYYTSLYLCCHTQKKSVTDYMHQSDGKKRNLIMEYYMVNA